MAKTTRQIIHIDEELCDGCGLCVPACAEGAIQIVEGKARLVSETYCDGLGACLGDCPQGAISMEEREADEYDQAAVDRHLAKQKEEAEPLPCGCPGSLARSLAEAVGNPAEREPGEDSPAAPMSPEAPASRLANWPVQIHLMPIHAPYLDDAHLTIAADCAAFAHPDFHRRFLTGRVLLIGCPKLDDSGAYERKLTEMFRARSIRSVEVPYMEVPCCQGLVRLVLEARERSGKSFPVTLTRIGIQGEIQEGREVPVPVAQGEWS